MTAFIDRPPDTRHVAAAAARSEHEDPEVRIVDVTAPVGFPCRVTLA